MKRNLPITGAAAALLLGTVFAAAQGQAPSGGAPERQAPPAASPQGSPQSGPMNEAPPPRTQGQGGGQAQEKAPEGKSKAPAQGQRDTSQPQQAPTQRDTQKSTQDKAGAKDKAAEGKAGTQGADVKLTTEQRTKIRTTVLQGGNRVTNVNFSISVGTVVPRTVRLVAVPPTLIEIYPAWRSYVYFIVEERIIIVEPSSHKIVAVLVV